MAPAALIAFLVGLLVEIGQAVDLLGLIGLADQRIARVVLGTAFSIADIICYAAGAAIVLWTERWRGTRKTSPESLAFPRESP